MGVETVSDNGDRIIRGSMRPDGTYRPDRKVRAGYVPQDEQPVYESKEALARRGYQKCPGLDEKDVSAETPKSKSAKKNERRKQKKHDIEEDVTLNNGNARNLEEDLDNLRIADGHSPSSLSNTEKKIRTIKKKLQQAEAIQARQQNGEKLTQPEEEKMGKIAVWRQELQNLQESCKS